MLKIGEFSKLARVSVKTLRYYADLGLLRPAYVDRYSGYRYYSLEQLPRLNRILALKELGFSLAQIEQMVREDLGTGELQRLMRLKHAELRQQVQAEQARLERVAVRLRQIEQEGQLPAYEVLVKAVEAQPVAGIRDTVSAYADVAELFRELWSYLQSQGAASPKVAPVGLYFDAEYRDQGADVEVAVPLAAGDGRGRQMKGNSRVLLHTLPRIEAASVVYTGAYEGISNAYGALVSWTQSHGYRTAGPNREIYLQGPGPGVEPARYITEIQFPAQPATAAQTEAREDRRMEPRIVTKEAFTVVGIPFEGPVSSGPYEDGENNNEIGKAWDVFNSRAGEIKHWSGPAIGLCFGMPDSEGPWYIAGAQVSQVDAVPPGMMARDVPAQKYAVFECTLPTLSQTYRYIMEQWQPASGYERADAPDFEVYDEKWDMNDPQGSPMYVYWPVK
jgi:predicted transcriptional regulator YdeE/DNA-binding transcriptional MerR regulator